MSNKIGIIGFGNMGSAIAEQLKSKYDIYVFDKDLNRTRDLSGIRLAKDSIDLLKQAETVILAVKPQDFENLLNEIKDSVGGKLVISIAAGITTAYIEKFLGKVKVIRVMPNLGAKIAKAESSLCKGRYAEDKDLSFTKELFDCLGKTWIMEEEMIDAATAIAGSGPAYIYYDMEINKYDPKNLPESVKNHYIERLTKAAERVGFNHQIAYDLAVSTTASSLSLSVVTGIPPAELRKQVTSKGGTTEAALKILATGGSWEEAAEVAKKRAKELSKKP
jgi:pyrroline-5-carboxylate reductase